ncbi:3'-5' exoribonuclease domain-containing protein [Chromobacterium amazonense]|uniref:3'-5' exoribonuclease domain-containing protein n=1 Tax=Chromobacterium amazonense TaxID=1382803 RepID=UPI003F79DAEC
MKINEILVCVDIESNGPVAGMHSMLAFGAVAFDQEGNIYSEFERNLFPVDGLGEHLETMKWWEKQQEAWSLLQQDRVTPLIAMQEFADWLAKLPGQPVLVSHPASFDYSFMHWYSFQYLGGVSFHIAGLDIPSYAMAVLGVPYTQAKRKFWPKYLNDVSSSHTHLPIDDARGHAQAFCNLIKLRNHKFLSS